MPTETALQEAPEALAARELEDVDLWTQLEKEWQALVARTDGLVADFVSVATIEKEYDDPILVAVATEAPLEEDFDDDEDWDDSAFAVSGAVQEPIAAASVPQTTGFGDYTAPVLSTPVSSPSVPSNQVSPECAASLSDGQQFPPIRRRRVLRGFRRRERARLPRNAWKRRRGLALKSSNFRRSSTAMPSPKGSVRFLKEDETLKYKFRCCEKRVAALEFSLKNHQRATRFSVRRKRYAHRK